MLLLIQPEWPSTALVTTTQSGGYVAGFRTIETILAHEHLLEIVDPHRRHVRHQFLILFSLLLFVHVLQSLFEFLQFLLEFHV